MYRLESDLMRDFTRLLSDVDCPIGKFVGYAEEFYFITGRADVVAVDDGGKLFAFEGKLTKWRDAMHQAYRNRNFARYSYVVLGNDVAEKAYCFKREFESRGIGLCCVGSGGMMCLIPAREEPDPLQPWLMDKAISYINSQEHVYA